MKAETKYILIGLGVFTGLLLLSRIKKSGKKGFSAPATGKITSGFGNRIHPITGQKKFHNGIDLGLPENTPIYAPNDGVVETASTDSQNGNFIILKHENGYKTGYAHLNKHLVKAGQKIKKGDKIALSGNTGASTGAHLHFTMTDPKGEKVDPLKHIKFIS